MEADEVPEKGQEVVEDITVTESSWANGTSTVERGTDGEDEGKGGHHRHRHCQSPWQSQTQRRRGRGSGYVLKSDMDMG